MNKYTYIGAAAVLATELVLGCIFQGVLGHTYPMGALLVATFFFLVAVGLGAGLSIFFNDGAINNKLYTTFKGCKSLLCLLIAGAMLLLLDDKAVVLELLIRFAAFYLVQLVFETWALLSYAKALK